MIEATIHPLDGGEPIDIDQVDYVSFINNETYGKPAIIAPGPDHVQGDIRVLYVNTLLVAAVEVHKIGD